MLSRAASRFAAAKFPVTRFARGAGLAIAASRRAWVPLPKLRLRNARMCATFTDVFRTTDEFERRHIGPSEEDIGDMLRVIGATSLDDLVSQTIPDSIRLPKELDLPPALTESEALSTLRALSRKNKLTKSLIGAGYYGTHTPAVIQRNMLENPGWYTAYTPYQAEIAQGRLEMLLNFQTMVSDMTGLPVANASLLDEATAAAEAMNLCWGHHRKKRSRFLVANDVHPQTLAVLQTRAEALGIQVVREDPRKFDLSSGDVCGVLVQYPNTYGEVFDYSDLANRAHDAGALVVASTDLLALSVLRPPGEFGADVAVGNAQRLGVPMGYGGPHAAFMAVTEEHKRRIPGRIIGVSIDAEGKRALRMAMQTREQHIRRDKATSNICTAQALLANMAAAYAVYHGPEGLRATASRVHQLAHVLQRALSTRYPAPAAPFFDTLTVDVAAGGTTADRVVGRAEAAGLTLRRVDDDRVGVSLDETVTRSDVEKVLDAFGVSADLDALAAEVGADMALPAELQRTTAYLTHPVFHEHRSETGMLRYLHSLASRDLSLTRSMISLGSCTMKLNAASQMAPVSWPEFSALHPLAPATNTQGYHDMVETLNHALARITGFAAVSAQPNSGAAGEYAGLMCIREYHKARGQGHRDVCLIPTSAHGTNPASAVMAGMRVVAVRNDERGNVDVEDLRAKAAKYRDQLAALMVTYPSTYGVFEEAIREVVATVHDNGGQVYMDGANMNAQVGLTSPGEIGADVCHLNLHKTFCIPHGGGGPGVGSIAVAAHLAPFLPGHPLVPVGGEGSNTRPKTTGAVAAAPFGSASILPISWMYIHMMGAAGLRRASQVAILNANYMATRLSEHYGVVFLGAKGRCAHEFILDIRPFKACGITEEDVAKRLVDYGFHAPTMSWPVPGTLMIEPTESENRQELDRFVDALISIRQEIRDVEEGRADPENNALKNAPHTADTVCSDTWDRPYSRELAAYPLPWVRDNKFWPAVGRVDNVYGDRNLICTCPSVEEVAGEA